MCLFLAENHTAQLCFDGKKVHNLHALTQNEQNETVSMYVFGVSFRGKKNQPKKEKYIWKENENIMVVSQFNVFLPLDAFLTILIPAVAAIGEFK